MRRLPPSKFDLLNFSVPDEPDNCSTNFLLHRSTSTILVDNPLDPKMLVVSYPTDSPPPMYFIYGKAERPLSIQRLLQELQTPTDLVVPNSMLNMVSHYCPVRFSVPVMFLAAPKGHWQPQTPTNYPVRLLTENDTPQLARNFSDDPWLWEFFFTPDQLIREGMAVGAFVNGHLACVATTLAFTERYVELGVATGPEYRGLGLALECCRALSRIQYEQFGRLPCWRTQVHNVASWKVALKLGLEELDRSEKYLFLSNYQHVGAYAAMVAP